MLYTRRGDRGTTTTLRGAARVSKNSTLTEALGAVDEINSLLGLCRVAAATSKLGLADLAMERVINHVQEDLFIIQAELAGADKVLSPAKVLGLEWIVNEIEKLVPPIRSFFIAGGTELAARLDYARTVARRAERRVVAARDLGETSLSATASAYLNRLSSLLYALARLANHQSGIKEEAPSYC